MNYSLLRSRTFWTIVATFILGGGNAIFPVIPAQFQTVLLLALGALASYFHLETGKSTSGTN